MQIEGGFLKNVRVEFKSANPPKCKSLFQNAKFLDAENSIG